MSSQDERLTQRRGIETRPLAQGALLVDMETGRCYRLNRVGAEIWGLLGQPRRAGQICEEISQRYGRAPASIEGDLRQLVEDLVKDGLIEVLPG